MGLAAFSVIIPAYNAEKSIERSISSVLDQSYESFEIIVVNDGSTDNTEEIIKRLNNDKIKIISQKNQGVSVARNVGIKNSNNTYICFLDADDAWLPNHLEVLSNLIEKYKNESFFVTGYKMLFLDGREKTINASINEDDYLETNLFSAYQRYGYFFNTNYVCIKKEAIIQTGGFAVGVKNEEDYDMWCRLGLKNNIVISKCITNLRYRDYSMATKTRLLLNDWVFESRIPDILKDETIPIERIAGVKRLIAGRQLTKVRHLLLMGNKRQAIKTFLCVKPGSVSSRRWLVTLACIPVPSVLLKKIVLIQERGLYRQGE